MKLVNQLTSGGGDLGRPDQVTQPSGGGFPLPGAEEEARGTGSPEELGVREVGVLVVGYRGRVEGAELCLCRTAGRTP